MNEPEKYRLVFTPLFTKVVGSLKRKSPDLVRAIKSHLLKLEIYPELGKPMRHTLRNYRRIHIGGSFVLLYEIKERRVYLIDFDHHDRIYKKYS